MIEQRIEQIERELDSIKQRNARVEADKAWEGSSARIIVICGITYAVAAIVLCLIGVERFWLSALVPVLGFYLSAQSLPAIKAWWVKSCYKNNRQ